jgi:hypothetical protein
LFLEKGKAEYWRLISSVGSGLYFFKGIVFFGGASARYPLYGIFYWGYPGSF